MKFCTEECPKYFEFFSKRYISISDTVRAGNEYHTVLGIYNRNDNTVYTSGAPGFRDRIEEHLIESPGSDAFIISVISVNNGIIIVPEHEFFDDYSTLGQNATEGWNC